MPIKILLWDVARDRAAQCRREADEDRRAESARGEPGVPADADRKPEQPVDHPTLTGWRPGRSRFPGT